MGNNYTNPEQKWVKPDDPLILDRLEWFRDQKLGFMVHWGPYSQLGIVESWALSDKDADWSRNGVDWVEDGEEFRRQYFDLNKTFNPIRFRPDEWAEIAYEGGFKYLIFTTKHHDGFCMWDTQYTNYKITDKECPFHMHKYADITKNLFDAFREKGLGIAAYFSKADWHSPYYWTPNMEKSKNTWRGPTYDTTKFPWLWNQFVEFTHNQIMELINKYGKIDILWLDAAWVCPEANQDLNMPLLAQKVRKVQPWLIIVDRWIEGPYENYLTPEQSVLKEPINVPWESCITMGTSFSYCYDDKYKSVKELVHLLIDVVAKGGNLALNAGAQPDGRLPANAVKLMKELGKWIKTYGEAIYGTRICEPYLTDKFAFTKKENNVYCFRLYKDKNIEPHAYIEIPYNKQKVLSVDLIGFEDNLYFEQNEKSIKVKIPQNAYSDTKNLYTHVFRMKTK